MAYDFPNSPSLGQVANGYTYDGEKWVQVANVPNTSGVIAIKVFTASGTYVPSPNMTTCVVEVRGSGGGGGSAFHTTVGNLAAGGGGGQGSLSRSTFGAATIGTSQPIVIGLAGVGGAPNAGNGAAGTDCSFGTLVIAKGGQGGGFSDPVVQSGFGGLGGIVGTGQYTEPGVSGGAGNTATANTAGTPSGFGGGAG